MRGAKNGLWLVGALAAGAVMGGLVAESLQASQVLGPITDTLVRQYQIISVPPVDVDLYIAKLTIGFTFSPNLVAIVGMVLGAIIYNKL